MINGYYEHSVDEKYRIRIPSKLKDELGSKPPVIAKGIDGCLNIYSNEAVEAMNRKMLLNPPKTKAELNALRKFTSSMFTLTEDKQGRFTLSANLREFASITKDVVFVGVIDHIELWSKERYEESMNSVSDDDYDATLLGFFGNGMAD